MRVSPIICTVNVEQFVFADNPVYRRVWWYSTNHMVRQAYSCLLCYIRNLILCFTCSKRLFTIIDWLVNNSKSKMGMNCARCGYDGYVQSWDILFDANDFCRITLTKIFQLSLYWHHQILFAYAHHSFRLCREFWDLASRWRFNSSSDRSIWSGVEFRRPRSFSVCGGATLRTRTHCPWRRGNHTPNPAGVPQREYPTFTSYWRIVSFYS